jgi:hypothetical protein
MTTLSDSGDMFAAGPPGSCSRKHPRFDYRQPQLYVYVGGDLDRVTVFETADEALGDAEALDRWAFVPRFVALLSAKRDAAEGVERERLTRLAVLVGVHLAYVPELGRRLLLERQGASAADESGR